MALLLLSACGVSQPDAPVRSIRSGDVASFGTLSGGLRIPVVSYREYPYQRVERQAYDYSCGAAAVATLLTYHYGRPTTEKDVLKAMWTVGDQGKIVNEGFSMLDMKDYLQEQGLRAGGFRMSLDAVAAEGIPVITLIDADGYKHFVVLKGIVGDHVLLGDPQRGNIVVTRDAFEEMWSGVILAALERVEYARRTFNTEDEWRTARQSSSQSASMVQQNSAATSVTRLPPTPIQFRPTFGD